MLCAGWSLALPWWVPLSNETALDTGGEVRWRPTGEWMGMGRLHEQGPHMGMEWHPACVSMCEDVLVSWGGQFHVPLRFQ
jgi:hypothetical protein